MAEEKETNELPSEETTKFSKEAVIEAEGNDEDEAVSNIENLLIGFI